MSSTIATTICGRSIPNSVNDLLSIFIKLGVIRDRNQYHFYIIDKKGNKVAITDSNILQLKKEYLEVKELCISAEKSTLNDFLSESIMIYPSSSKSFEEKFAEVCDEILKHSDKEEICFNEVIHKLNGVLEMEKFTKVLSMISGKYELLKKKFEIVKVIASDLEAENINFREEISKSKFNSEANKFILDSASSKLNSISISGSTQGVTNISGSDLLKQNETCSEIITKLSAIHREFLQYAEFYDSNSMFTKIFSEKIDFEEFKGPDSSRSLGFIDKYIDRIKILSVTFLESLNLNEVYQFHKNSNKTIFCNLCNDFKKPSPQEMKICDRHSICENCLRNYSKKIKCIKEKICYCQTKV